MILPMIFTFASRIFIALILLIATSLSYVSANFQTTFDRVVSQFGSSYKAQTVATKKDFSLVSRKIRKDHPSLKVVAQFSRAGVDFHFAISKLCITHQWSVTPRTYDKCRKFAEERDFLNAPLVSHPDNPRSYKLTYEQLATLLARSIEYKTTPRASTPNPTRVVTVPSEVPARGLPIGPTENSDGGTYDEHFFSTVQLDERLPRRFYIGEVYTITGTVLSDSTDSVFVFVCSRDSDCDTTENFSQPTTAGNRFSIPVHFNTAGTFNLGIVPGQSGESRLADITVVAQEPNEVASANSPRPTATGVRYNRGETTFSWNANGFVPNNTFVAPTFTRLIIYQNNKRADFLFRQPLTRYTPPPSTLKGFSAGNARWMVLQNGAASASQTMDIVTQHFYKHEADDLSIGTFTDFFGEAQGATLHFEGTAKTGISKTIALTLPNGTVKEVIVSDEDFKAGERITLTLPLTDVGTYIFEVNDLLGSAVLNAPVYVGAGTPLLPDFFALNKQVLTKTPLGSVNDARLAMLSLINRDRTAQGLQPVTLDTSLNAIAQAHSDSMLAQNFFGHVNPQGKSPDDRRRAAGFITPIRENLGKSTSLEHVEAGLMRSPVHRDALLDPRMKRVGIGIVKTSEGYFLVTQNFAGDAMTEAGLREVKNQLMEQVTNFRRLNGLPGMVENTDGNNAATSWARAMATNNFFGLSAPAGCTTANTNPCPGASITDTVRKNGIRSGFEVYIVRTSTESVLSEEITAEAGLSNGQNRTISIGLSVGSFGEIYMVVLYF